MKPSVGRIVHYVEYRDNYTCRAAMITEVDEEDGTVSLTVFTVNGIRSFGDAHYSDDNHDCTWHWPERVDG